MSDNVDDRWQMNIRSLNQGVLKISQNKEFSDAVIKVRSRTFEVHRFILASRSPVFVNLLLSNYTDGDEIEIKDDSVSENGFETLLGYAYTGAIDTEDKKSIIEAYLAARYFKVKKLIDICKQKIEAWEITEEEVCKLLDIGLTIPTLKIDYLAYIRNNANKVIDSSSFLHVSFKCMEAILENGALSDVQNVKRIRKVMEWAEKRYTKPVKYELVRKEFENASPTLMSKLGIQDLNFEDLAEISRQYKGFLTNIEVLTFLEYVTDKKVELPSWCTSAI